MEQPESINLKEYVYGDIFLTKNGRKAKYVLQDKYAHIFFVEGEESLRAYDSGGNDFNYIDQFKLIKKIGHDIRKS